LNFGVVVEVGSGGVSRSGNFAGSGNFAVKYVKSTDQEKRKKKKKKRGHRLGAGGLSFFCKAARAQKNIKMKNKKSLTFFFLKKFPRLKEKEKDVSRLKM
jgi:hypothetical protein